jgi:hypothetical protein
MPRTEPARRPQSARCDMFVPLQTRMNVRARVGLNPREDHRDARGDMFVRPVLKWTENLIGFERRHLRRRQCSRASPPAILNTIL